jgi:L-fucose isomerase-like protein
MSTALFILGRATFDVTYAESRVAAALNVLDGLGVETVGPREILYDAEAVTQALAGIDAAAVDRVLIVQATFCDAGAAVAIAEALPVPLTLWAFPEPRTGGRLRLNAFCGLNLAAHALGLRGRALSYLYADPAAADAAQALAEAMGSPPPAAPAVAPPAPGGDAAAAQAGLAAMRGAKIARIGQHPDGFDTCAYDEAALRALCGAGVEAIDLHSLFDTARAADPQAVAALRAKVSTQVSGLDDQDQAALDRSLRLRLALEALKQGGGYDGFAIRCWPETFTEYGGAVCGPVGMMGEGRAPCACEADVYGALSLLMLQAVADAPAFLADVVDMDAASDTGVVWHCGQAPISMADAAYQPEAAIHSNRRLPLLYQFPLKPGRVTLARISQAQGKVAMVLATGEAVKAPPAFSGTSGTIRFDRPAPLVAERLVAGGIEHHLGLVYGDHAPTLHAIAADLGLPVLDLTA